MDANFKKHAGGLASFLGNWDHKPKLIAENSPVPEIFESDGWMKLGNRSYNYDILSNIHYGYVGRAAGFSENELIGGAGLEQFGSVTYRAIERKLTGAAGQARWPSQTYPSPTWLSAWDDPSDTAAIEIGVKMWLEYGMDVQPADIYLAILEEPRLRQR